MMIETLPQRFQPYIEFVSPCSQDVCVICGEEKIIEQEIRCLKDEQTDHIARVCASCYHSTHFYQTNKVFLLDRHGDIGTLYTTQQVCCDIGNAGVPVLRQVENTTPVCSLQYTVWFHYQSELWKGTYFDNSVIVYARSTMHRVKPLERENL